MSSNLNVDPSENTLEGEENLESEQVQEQEEEAEASE